MDKKTKNPSWLGAIAILGAVQLFVGLALRFGWFGSTISDAVGWTVMMAALIIGATLLGVALCVGISTASKISKETIREEIEAEVEEEVKRRRAEGTPEGQIDREAIRKKLESGRGVKLRKAAEAGPITDRAYECESKTTWWSRVCIGSLTTALVLMVLGFWKPAEAKSGMVSIFGCAFGVIAVLSMTRWRKWQKQLDAERSSYKEEFEQQKKG